ncbi:hypothetical protein JXQ70_03730 [bacterium]|nr:hypothetical protein [bacterium]
MKSAQLIITFSLAVMLCAGSPASASLLDEEFADPDFSTPAGQVDHVFNFFHHSCGGNLLSNGLASGLTNLGYTLHSQTYNQYVYENNYTDYRHWYKRFQRELGIESGGVYYRYEGPDAYGEPILGAAIDQDGFMLTWYEYQAETMDIIMFKPCYPGSAVSTYDTTYAGGPDNNGYGAVLSGTPYSDNGNNNFTYLNSSTSVSASYGTTYWSYGSWSGSGSSLAQMKAAYRGMLNIFKEHPQILFIAMQAPPMVSLSDTQAAGCREFARWMREDWLHQFDPTGTDQFEDYPLPNVVPSDFHNSVAWTANDAGLDAEYFWFPVGGFTDDSMDTTDPNLVGRNAGSQDHPDSWLNHRTAVIFCGGTDSYSPPYTGNTGREYSCWINAVVNRWEGGSALTEVTDVGWAASSTTNLSWATTPNADTYHVYRGTPSDLPNLLDSNLDSCLKWSGSTTQTGEGVLDLVPAVDSFYWFIVLGENSTQGFGPAGDATSGPRQLDSSGDCSN